MSEAKVAAHYTHGRLEETILRALMRTGKDAEHLTALDFAALDQFHVGGLEATRDLATLMDLHPGLHLLDVGSGVGGPARYFAAEHGCHVTGIDLTEEFVQVAQSLTRMLKLDHLVQFQNASALKLPFEAETFDRAYMIHVGMNIAAKGELCREVRRVLKSDGLFAVFDVVRSGDGLIRYPVPWALDEQTSFLDDLKTYRDALEQAGFRVAEEHSQRAFAIEFTERVMARMAQEGPPVLGLQLLIGEKTPLMLANILAMMREGVLEPVELLARAV